MKKLLLTALAATTLSMSANAAVKKGDMAPDFTITDINGVSQHLYDYLNQGYTVVIDVSAAWCAPCWAAHTSGVLDNLMDHYGPSGTITPGKVMVIFIEGESTNTLAQIQGTTTAQTYAGFSQGNWTKDAGGVNSVTYPIIDNPPSATLNAYLDGGFPTFTVVGRDRIVYNVTAGYGSAMNESWFMNIANQAPTTALSSTTDAKPVATTDENSYICQAAPKVRFQNYGTQTITAATVNVKSGSTTVSTQNWTGSLTSYNTADVTMPAFSQAGPYTYEVVVAGDANASNNTISNVALDVITASMASAMPYSEDFQGSNTDLPTKYKMNEDAAENMFFNSAALSAGGNPITVIGKSGSATNTLATLFGNNNSGYSAEIQLGNYNTSAGSNPGFTFDWAYQPKTTSSTDKIEILSSADCGATWQSLWVGTGTSLASKTGTVPSGTFFLPSAATDWKTKSVVLPKNNNVFIKLVATTGSDASYAWLDNFKVSSSVTSVNDLISESSVSIYPNPVHDMATLEFDVIKSSNVTIQVIDMTGRIAVNVANEAMNAGTHKVSINTANLTAGVYNVKIQTENGARTERLTVVK